MSACMYVNALSTYKVLKYNLDSSCSHTREWLNGTDMPGSDYTK